MIQLPTKRIIKRLFDRFGVFLGRGLSEMNTSAMAENFFRVGFTEIVRFEVTDESRLNLNGEGEVNIRDLVLVAQFFGETDSTADVNGDGMVNNLDLVPVANHRCFPLLPKMWTQFEEGDLDVSETGDDEIFDLR